MEKSRNRFSIMPFWASATAVGTPWIGVTSGSWRVPSTLASMPTSIRYLVTSARRRLNVSLLFISIRSRGRGMDTLNSSPKVPSGFRAMMRSARMMASSTSLVINTQVFLSASQMLSISSARLARVNASSADKGSSSSSTSGFIAKARATFTRWRMPPDSSAGRRPAAWDRPTMPT
mmetsp:Transcript_13743/g.23397  ORF Transcript_13743/g.23397 Transcript_13743/m.23397 type:complete len:176 (-) Transcript_13743:1646-2173(-)